MSDYCLYPNQCGIGMDCSECMSGEIVRLQSEVDRLQADNDHQRGRRNAARKCIKSIGEGSPWLLRKQAEAFEAEAIRIIEKSSGSTEPLYATCLKDSAQRLIQQAAEKENGD